MQIEGLDRPPELDVGDRVVALHRLGGLLRPTVPRGTPGLIIARDTTATLTVRFTNGQTLNVDPADVALPDPRDTP